MKTIKKFAIVLMAAALMFSCTKTEIKYVTQPAPVQTTRSITLNYELVNMQMINENSYVSVGYKYSSKQPYTNICSGTLQTGNIFPVTCPAGDTLFVWTNYNPSGVSPSSSQNIYFQYQVENNNTTVKTITSNYILNYYNLNQVDTIICK